MKRLLFLFLLPGFLFAQRPHKFKSGDKLPGLVLTSAFGDSIHTDSLRGKKILITFNRYVSFPIINYRTHELLEYYDSLKTTGLVFISVYESGKETLTQYAAKEEIPFFMIADPQETFYKKFKVQKNWWKTFLGLFNHYRKKHAAGKFYFRNKYERDGHLNRIGADFLIDEHGIIHTAYYGKFVGDHLPLNEIIKWVLNK